MERWLELCSKYIYDPYRNLPVNSGSHMRPVFHPTGWKTPAVLTGVLSIENTKNTIENIFCSAISKSTGASWSFSGKKNRLQSA